MWSQNDYADKLRGRQVTVVCDGHAYLLRSDDGETTTKTELSALYSSLEETDSRYDTLFHIKKHCIPNCTIQFLYLLYT